MYTTIPHQDLIDQLRLCLTQAWNWQARQENVSVDRIRLEMKCSVCKWVVRSARSKDVYKAGYWLVNDNALLDSFHS